MAIWNIRLGKMMINRARKCGARFSDKPNNHIDLCGWLTTMVVNLRHNPVNRGHASWSVQGPGLGIAIPSTGNWAQLTMDIWDLLIDMLTPHDTWHATGHWSPRDLSSFEGKCGISSSRALRTKDFSTSAASQPFQALWHLQLIKEEEKKEHQEILHIYKLRVWHL